jgi:hypothetical protein
LKRIEIEAISDTEIQTPHHIPLDIYIQEAENLYKWCQADQEALTRGGLNWEIVEDIPLRNGALIFCESEWYVRRKEGRAAQREWAARSPEAYSLKKQLLKDFRFAFRKRPQLLETVSSIISSSGHAAMIQDLNDLAVIGRKHTELLETIGFETAKLDRAAELASEMAKLLACVTSERMEYDETRKRRDQAYTYLKQAVDEVRECGRYVFDRESPRYKGYGSMHLRRIRQGRRRKK